jgi:hypothetical protein
MRRLPGEGRLADVTESALATAPAGSAPDPSKSTGHVAALWFANLLLKIVGFPDPPDSLRQAVAAFVFRFGWLILFGMAVPLLCAFGLNAMDRLGAGGLADAYRNYVVSGFSINETIYRADRDRIDYLLQMRRINFFEQDDLDSDPSVVISVMPGQEGTIVVDRAMLTPKPLPASPDAGGTGPATATPPALVCPSQLNPNLATVNLRISDMKELSTKTSTVRVGEEFPIDAAFWAEQHAAKTVKALRVLVEPNTDAKNRKDCFDLTVDLRVEVFKTKDRG